jgi:hypothetical protein
MNNFVQATEYEVYVDAKLEYLDTYIFFVIEYFGVWVVKFLQEAIVFQTSSYQA